jgi:MFS family permease
MDLKQTTGKSGRKGLSRNIIVLGVVSLLTDLSSEMMVPLIPLFLTDVLKTPVQFIGLIEGIAESIASLLRVIAGWLSDRLGRPKLLATLGYSLSSVAKPFLALATWWPTVLLIRFTERFGKGIRSAPRDVIITESVEPERRGRAFGFHRAMDTTGALLGPLAAWFIISYFTRHHFAEAVWYKNIFLIATVPAIIGVVVLAALVPEKPKPAHYVAPPKIRWGALSKRLKIFLLVVGIFSLGNSSDAFLILRAKTLGVSPANILLIYVIFNAVSAACAMPAGIISDRVGRRPVLVAGLLIFALTYLGFAVAKTPIAAWVLFGVYGLYGGLTSGVLKAFAADLAPREIRGTVIGAYYTVEGIALLPASLFAGLMWRYVGVSAPFYYGAAMAAIAVLTLVITFPPGAERQVA